MSRLRKRNRLKKRRREWAAEVVFVKDGEEVGAIGEGGMELDKEAIRNGRSSEER